MILREPTLPARRGRPCAFELTEAEVAAARRARAVKGSLAVAVGRWLADPAVRPETIERVRAMVEAAEAAGKAPVWPLSLRRAFQVTAQERAAARGRKALEKVRYKATRGLYYVDEEGAQVALQAHDLWELDDYSTNQPFWWTNPAGEAELGRQVLCGMDVASAGWLGAMAIGRGRDAYRKEDIALFVFELIQTHGTLPVTLRLERGRWENTTIHGIESKERPGYRWGDWERLMRIEHVLTSGAKGLLEGSFNPLQARLAHEGRDIGRVRGEFAAAARDLRRAAAGTEHPRDLGFVHQDLSMRLHRAAMEAMNASARQRKALGRAVVPDEVLEAGPSAVRPLPAGERWRFLPFKVPGTVRNGVVEVTDPRVTGRKLRYQVNGVAEGVLLDQGYRVLVAFDPADPGRPAAIGNREVGAANREAYGFGEILVHAAPAETLRPQFVLDRRDADYGAKSAADAAARRSFTAIGLRGRSADVVRLVDETDGRGAKVAMRKGPAVAPAPARVASEATGTGGDDFGGRLARENNEVRPTRDRMMELLGVTL